MATCRGVVGLLAAVAVLRAPGFADELVRIGVDLSLTGSDAASALRQRNGAALAFDAANAQHAVPGVTFEAVVFDDGTPTAGQYDPAQAANNARRMVSDKTIVAAIGPQTSGAAQAMSPILSQGNLATISASSTNPDLTDPKYAAQYRPGGKITYFRTVTTDAYQGPNMANYYADVLKVKSVYVLDDGGAYGVGIADSFQAQAEKKGIKVLGRDRLDPATSDYTAVLNRIKSLNANGLYFGGQMQAGVKLVKQAADRLPTTMPKAGGDGLYDPEMLTGAGFPAAENWYATIASPHLTQDSRVANFIKAYRDKFGNAPDDYSITAYDGASVIIDAVKRLRAGGIAVTREAMRNAIAATKVNTLQGRVSFDHNGDLTDRTISVFQLKEDKNRPRDELEAQFRYVGIAPD